MSALSAALLIFSFQFSLLFSMYRSPAAPALWCTIGFNTQNIGHRTLPKFGYVPFLCETLSSEERLWIDSNRN